MPLIARMRTTAVIEGRMTTAMRTRASTAGEDPDRRRRHPLPRRHREDGSFRDTVVFSILGGEWPAVKAGLQRRVED
ncbi:hypothetical protein [Blastococcus sp. CT_GayMR20]|uniref:hypothetical protein n=1 Tax=Blastococcus sp. CT_GayMR20 TaxID=2559609 RepID=UPI001ADD6898|nr:hypothetical protein [Blastococcus sp. CT_GayMR20]